MQTYATANLYGAVVDEATVIMDAKIHSANLEGVNLDLADGYPDRLQENASCD